MAEFPDGVRTASNRKRFREDSRRLPAAPETGKGRVGQGGFQEAQTSERIDWLEWVRTNLPDEHPSFASPAAQLLRRADRKMPTAEQVRERLVAEGKDGDTLRAKGWM